MMATKNSDDYMSNKNKQKLSAVAKLARNVLRSRNSDDDRANFVGITRGVFYRRGDRRVNIEDGELRYTWQQDLGASRVAEKSAIVQGDIITLRSRDPNLARFGFQASTTTYDFTTGSAVVAMRTRFRSPCFLTDDALSREDLVGGSVQLNGTLAAPSARVTLDGTSQPLSRAARDALYRTNPALKEACGRRSIVPTVEPGAAPTYTGTTRELKLLTFDGEITIIARTGPVEPS